MHIDKATPHNSTLSLHKTEELGFTRLVQLPYSPDLALCDFFIFGYLKKELHEKNFRLQNVVISVMRAILTKSPFERSHESSTNRSRDYTGVLQMRGTTSK
jgi:hypothetical protein